MQKRIRKKIFEAFTQASQNISQPGTGLGLAICRRLIAAMGGQLSLKSKLNEGSFFSFTIPLALGEPLKEESDNDYHLKPYTVLLVEDNPVNCKVAEGYLKRIGQRVITCMNGAEARAAIALETVDLVLMDINLPDTDGVSLSRELRQITNRHIPVIAVSAHVFHEEQSRFIEAGMDACLGKPLRIEALVDAINIVMAEQSPLSISSPEQVDDDDSISLSTTWLNERQLQEDIEILGEEQVRQMIELFTKSASQTMQELKNSNDIQRQKALAHTLKGAAASVGLMQLHEQAGQFEQNPGEASIDDFEQCFQKSLQILNRFSL